VVDENIDKTHDNFPMSPRELPNSIQVAPGRYVSNNPEREREYRNKIRERKRKSGQRFRILDIDKIHSE